MFGQLHRMDRHTWLLTAILCIATILRFQNLGAIEHNVDHAYPIWQALMTLDRGVFPVTAQGTSVLFANPALTGYLFIPWVALTRSPIGAYIFVISLNTIAVWLAYKAAVLLLDKPRALIAVFLMAVNPWVIEYSRTTWVQALIPFWACLIFWLLTPVLIGCASHPGRRLVFAAAATAAMTQSYLLAFLILAPISVLLLLFRAQLRWRPLAVGIAIVAATTAIYALGLFAQRQETLERIQSFSSSQSKLSAEAWTHAVRLVSGQNYAISRGIDAPPYDWFLRQNLSEGVHYAILCALLAGIILSIHALLKRTTDARFGLISLIWFGLPILFMTYVSKPVHPFYLLLTLPAGYILAAKGAGILLRWRLSAIVLPLFGVFAGTLLGINALRYAQETLATPGAHNLGALPVSQGVDAMHRLLPPEVRTPGSVVFADVDEWTLNSLAGFLFPVDRDIRVEQITYVPHGGATYLLFGVPDKQAPTPLNAADSARVTLDDGTYIQRYRISAYPTKGEVVKSEQGISFLGWQLDTPLKAGTTANLVTYWRIDELKLERSEWLLGPFAHVYDASGSRVVVASGAVVPGAAWRLNDVHIQRIPITIPDNSTAPFKLVIGQYDGVHNLNAIFLPDYSATITLLP